jgi:hypothetical protein
VPWLETLPPAGRDAPGAPLEDQTPFLLVGDGQSAEHRLTALWLEEDGSTGLSWRVRLIVE